MPSMKWPSSNRRARYGNSAIAALSAQTTGRGSYSLPTTMLRKPHQRGVSLAAIVTATPLGIKAVTTDECGTFDFGTLPVRFGVLLRHFPIAETTLLLVRSGSRLRLIIRLEQEQDSTLKGMAAILRTSLIEAARELGHEGYGYRGRSENPRLIAWTSRYQRGDAVLVFAKQVFYVVCERARTLMNHVIESSPGQKADSR